LADTKAREAIAQLVEHQQQAGGWEIDSDRAPCTMWTIEVSALAFLEFSLSAVHELDVPAHVKGKKNGIRPTRFKKQCSIFDSAWYIYTR